MIASNVDATEGPELGLRQAFIGQNFIPAGNDARVEGSFPKAGHIRVLVGVNAPGQNWSEQRAKGMMDGLEEFKKANPGRKMVDRPDRHRRRRRDLADRVGAYISAHPDTTAYIEIGLWHSEVARMLKDRNIPPGKILMGGFDLAPR